MIKSHPISFSPASYKEDIKISLIRGHKYFRALNQFNDNEELSKSTINLFLKTIKRAKTLKAIKLQARPSDFNTKFGMVRSALKGHSKRLRQVDISGFPTSTSKRVKGLLPPIKDLNTIYISHSSPHIRNLPIFRKIENLYISISNNDLESDQLYKVLVKLVNLKNLCLSVIPSCLDKATSVLNRFSDKFQRPVRYQIISKEDHEYAESELTLAAAQRVSKLNLQYLNTEEVLQNLFSIQPLNMLNLRSLKLGFANPDLELVSSLRYIKQIPLLDKLSLFFTECWDGDFIEGIIKGIQLPVMLQDLKITMPIYFKNLIQKDMGAEKRQQGKYPWRKSNFFEQESLFSSFFQALEQAQYLKKVKFDFQLIESFNSHYTNFFVFIVNRLLNLSSLALHVSDYNLQEDFTHQKSQPFDLALFLKACSEITQLEHIEVLMPNLLFDDVEIDSRMTNLKSFAIGVTGNEEEEGISKFNNISKSVTNLIKRLLLVAPGLTSLVLDFTEVIDEAALCRRFMFIEGFKQLEAFCSRFVVNKCSVDTTNKVGRMLQSLKKLNTLVLKFLDSDKNILEMRKYIHYLKSLRDVLVSFDQENWIGKHETGSSNLEIKDNTFNNLYASSLNEQAIGFELENVVF